MATTPAYKKAETALRRYALTFPGAKEWGDRIVKAEGKIFVSFAVISDSLRVGVKLPTSAPMALELPFVEAGGRSLGGAGWVYAKFNARQKPDVNLLKGWIEQSYRAVAPKKLVALFDAPKGKAH